MALDPEYFKDYPDLTKGDRVKYVLKHDLSGGQGNVELIWLGIEEMCVVLRDDGECINICRAIGDTVEKI